MNKTHIVAGIALMLLGASTMATAYHISDDPTDPAAVQARTWIGGTGELVIVCESTGPGDKINPSLVGIAQPGEGGLCFASSQHISDKVDWKDKKEKIVQDEEGNFTWGAVEPKCEEGLEPDPCGPNKVGDVGQDWFARVNSNTRACDGAWGQTFVYKEMIAYYGGSGPNPENGISGHATFFVQDETAVSGTYNFNKFEEDPRDPVKTDATAVDPITGLPIEACNGNDIGLCDDTLKGAEPCDGAAKQ